MYVCAHVCANMYVSIIKPENGAMRGGEEIYRKSGEKGGKHNGLHEKQRQKGGYFRGTTKKEEQKSVEQNTNTP